MPRFPLSRLKSLGLRIPRPGFTAGVWLAAPVLVLLLVWQQASIDRLVVQLEAENDTHQELESQVNALRLEANRLSSLGQVEDRAERELGLIRPETDQIVNVVFASATDDRIFRLRSLVPDATANPPGERRTR